MAYSSPSSRIDRSNQIAAFPYLIATLDTDVKAFLDGLPFPDFASVAETKALWAARATTTGGTSPGSAYVVSAEAYKRVKAHRY